MAFTSKDAVAVYVGQKVGVLQVEGLVAIFALISLWIVFALRPRFTTDSIHISEQGSAAA